MFERKFSGPRLASQKHRRSLFLSFAKGLPRWIRGSSSFFAAVLVIAAPSCALADSVSVNYTTTQLSGAEWQYSYTVSGNLSVGDDISIAFPLGTSSALSDLGTGGPDFSTFVLQPDPNIPADGEFDIVVDNASPDLSSVFSVDFLLSGQGLPGPQSFTVYDSSFSVLQTGTTSLAGPAPSVPEPGSLPLLASGVAILFAFGLRRDAA